MSNNAKTPKDKSKNKKKNIPLFIALGVLGASLLGGGVFLGINAINNTKPKNDVDYPDIKAYFEENSEIKSVTKVKKSKNNLSEKDVIKELEDRGFNQYPVTTNYSIDGVFDDEKEVSADSKNKHPVYETYYVTEKGELWVISVIDGTITANPSYYNLEKTDKTPILVSESQEVVSYDVSTNSYYRTIPNKSVLDVRIVDKIDAKTIEEYKMESWFIWKIEQLRY